MTLLRGRDNQRKKKDEDSDYEAELYENSETTKYLTLQKSPQMCVSPLYLDTQCHVDMSDTTEAYVFNDILSDILDQVLLNLNVNF